MMERLGAVYFFSFQEHSDSIFFFPPERMRILVCFDALKAYSNRVTIRKPCSASCVLICASQGHICHNACKLQNYSVALTLRLAFDKKPPSNVFVHSRDYAPWAAEQSCETLFEYNQCAVCLGMRIWRRSETHTYTIKLVAALNFSCCRLQRALDYYVGTAVWPVIIALFNMHELFLPALTTATTTSAAAAKYMAICAQRCCARVNNNAAARRRRW